MVMTEEKGEPCNTIWTTKAIEPINSVQSPSKDNQLPEGFPMLLYFLGVWYGWGLGLSSNVAGEGGAGCGDGTLPSGRSIRGGETETDVREYYAGEYRGRERS